MAGDVKLPPPPEADDELDELPPLDGDGDEPDEGSEDEELDGDLDAEGRADALDDSTAEGDSALDEDIDTAGSESGWLDDAGESDALDVGIPDTFGDEEGATLLEGAEELDAEEEELGFSEGEAPIGDAGEEGFEEEEEEVREADLPPLDQDGTGEEGATDEPELLESLDEVDGDLHAAPSCPRRLYGKHLGVVRGPDRSEAIRRVSEGDVELSRVNDDSRVRRDRPA